MDWTNGVSAVANAVTALGIVFLWHQSHLLRRQLEADHERSRRKLTLDLIHQWNTSITPVTAAAEKVVKKLSRQQCRELADFRHFKLGHEYRPLLETCFAEMLTGDPLCEEGGQISLSAKQATRLRYLVAEYLNETEAVLLGWYMSIADREMIEHQFQFLYDQREGENALGTFREAMGGAEAFPAIETFVAAIRKRKQREGAREKSPVA